MTRIVFKIDIARSTWMLSYLSVLHILILATTLSVFTVSWWSLLFSVCLVLSFIHYCRQYQWLSSQHSIVKLERDAESLWYLFFTDNKQISKLTLSGSVVTPQIVILYLKGPSRWQQYTITILADAADSNLFRQLRIYLKHPKTFQK